jgi:hypothetical protein
MRQHLERSVLQAMHIIAGNRTSAIILEYPLCPGCDQPRPAAARRRTQDSAKHSDLIASFVAPSIGDFLL